MDLDDIVDLESLEASPQLNHVYNKANGDLENDLDSVKVMPAGALRRQSSVGSVTGRPVNGLKTHEHNVLLQKMAVVEVKKPGKGNTS